MKTYSASTAQIASRIAVSIVGAYVFIFGLASVGILAALAVGIAYNEAQTFFNLVSFLVFLPIFFWAYMETSLSKLWLILGGGGSTMLLFSWLMSSYVVGA